MTNLVFLRRVRSRILYEQMLGRGTRLCEDLHGPKEDKDRFRVFDAVNLYAALLPHSRCGQSSPAPSIPFVQIAAELHALTRRRAPVPRSTTSSSRNCGRSAGAGVERG